MESRVIVVNSTVGALDIDVQKQYLFFKGEKICRILDIDGNQTDYKKVGVAETRNVITVAIAATVLNSNSTNGEQKYSFKVTQYNPITNDTKTTTITHITPQYGTVNPTTVGDAIAAWINGQSGLGFTAVNTAGSIALTAAAGDGPIVGYVVSQPTAITITNTTTAYVAPVGTQQQVKELEGVVQGDVTATNYTIISLHCKQLRGAGPMDIKVPFKIYFCLDIAMTNYSALNARFVEVLKSFAASGSTVDPKIIAVES